MGWDLIIAMVIASVVTHAWENARTRAAARWQAARDEAQAQRQEREKARADAQSRRKERLRTARTSGPSDPLWWAYAISWLAVGAVRATAAAIAGARDGARHGAAEGYRIGRERAAERQARRLREEAAYANGYREGLAEERDQADLGDADVRVDTEPTGTGRAAGDGPPVDTMKCPRCRYFYVPAPFGDGICGCPLNPHGGEPRTAAENAPQSVETELITELCPKCQVYYVPDVAGGAGCRCGRVNPSQTLDPCSICGAAPEIHFGLIVLPCGCEEVAAFREQLNAPADPTPEVIDAEIVEEPNEGSNTMSELQAIGVNDQVMSGADGEGYTSTLTALGQIESLLAQLGNVVSELGDMLVTQEVDNETTTGISELYDLVDQATSKAAGVKAHVHVLHEPVAAAVNEAGADNVASRDWYGDF